MTYSFLLIFNLIIVAHQESTQGAVGVRDISTTYVYTVVDLHVSVIPRGILDLLGCNC